MVYQHVGNHVLGIFWCGLLCDLGLLFFGKLNIFIRFLTVCKVYTCLNWFNFVLPYFSGGLTEGTDKL